MRFLCIYKPSKPEGTPPTPEMMAAMGKLIEESVKSGVLLADRITTVSPTYAAEICTPAHGTAYDIAGKGIASVGATRAALLLAAEMAAQRRRSAFAGGNDERIPGAAAKRGRGQQ